MIPLTLGEVADGRRRAPARRRRPGRRRDRHRAPTRAASQPGDLFVAVVGEHHDAHDFAAAAIAAGAAAVLASRELDVPCVVVDDAVLALGTARALGGRPDARAHRRRHHRLVAARRAPRTCMAQVLVELGPVVAPQGSFNTEVGLPVTALQRRRRHARAGARRWAPAASGTSPTCAASHRRASASCSTSGPRTWRVRLAGEHRR